MKTKTLEYIEWEDLEQFFCEVLGIGSREFDQYHLSYYKIDRAEYWKKEKYDHYDYMNLWHVWIWMTDEKSQNGAIIEYYHNPKMDEEEQKSEKRYFHEKLREKFGEWAIDPAEKMLDALKKEFPDRESIWIHYWW